MNDVATESCATPLPDGPPPRPIPLMVIPTWLRVDLMLRCLASIDHPVDHLVLILQGEAASAHGLRGLIDRHLAHAMVRRLSIHTPPNLGCAGAWNLGIRMHPAPWWLLVNDDIQFTPGDLEAMARHVHARHGAVSCVYGNHGASWWAVTLRGVLNVGSFDENFFPAYLEDCDWSVRADRLGEIRENLPVPVTAVHGVPGQRGSCTANSSAATREWVSQCHGRGFAYYRAKWGGINEKETYKTPFNDPAWPLWAWRFDPVLRSQNLPPSAFSLLEPGGLAGV